MSIKFNLKAFVFMPLVLLAFAGCRSSMPVCSESSSDYICKIPYEVIYSNRDELVGKLVSINGVLVAGEIEGPPGTLTRKILLFSSSERAEICDLSEAVEIISNLTSIADEVVSMNGRHVSIAGRVVKDETQSWVTLSAIRSPAWIHGSVREYGCLSPENQPLIP